jgi:hypothetical protein
MIYPADSAPTPIFSSYAAYDCYMNGVPPDVLFAKYRDAGFLYPAKMQRLLPFLDLVKDNWRKAASLGEEILCYITHENLKDASWASVGSWRSTLTGWNSQHVVSIGGPHASRAVLLAGAAVRVERNREGVDNYQQNWFRPTNRFANKVFGSLVETIGSENSWVGSYHYLAMRPTVLPDADGVLVTRLSHKDKEEFVQLVRVARGAVFLRGEELDHDDVELEELDQFYRRAGLRRFRRIFVARVPRSEEILGAAVAYRGPLGFNFSFLENRCDLILRPGLSDIERKAAVCALLCEAKETYNDFEPGVLPLVTDIETGKFLVAIGAEFIREYAQSVWLQQGYIGWYRHVEAFYDRVLKAEHRRGLARQRNEESGG